MESLTTLITENLNNYFAFLIGMLITVGTVYRIFKTRIDLIIYILKSNFEEGKDKYIETEITNHSTIIKYLYSKNRDLYITAFKYIPHHSRYPKSIIKVITKIVLLNHPFNKYNWIDSKERLKVAKYLCLMLSKNNDIKFNRKFSIKNYDLCRDLIRKAH